MTRVAALSFVLFSLGCVRRYDVVAHEVAELESADTVVE